MVIILIFSGSVQSLQSLRFEETEKSSSSSDDEMTSSDDNTPRTLSNFPSPSPSAFHLHFFLS